MSQPQPRPSGSESQSRTPERKGPSPQLGAKPSPQGVQAPPAAQLQKSAPIPAPVPQPIQFGSFSPQTSAPVADGVAGLTPPHPQSIHAPVLPQQMQQPHLVPAGPGFQAYMMRQGGPRVGPARTGSAPPQLDQAQDHPAGPLFIPTHTHQQQFMRPHMGPPMMFPGPPGFPPMMYPLQPQMQPQHMPPPVPAPAPVTTTPPVSKLKKLSAAAAEFVPGGIIPAAVVAPAVAPAAAPATPSAGTQSTASSEHSTPAPAAGSAAATPSAVGPTVPAAVSTPAATVTATAAPASASKFSKFIAAPEFVFVPSAATEATTVTPPAGASEVVAAAPAGAAAVAAPAAVDSKPAAAAEPAAKTEEPKAAESVAAPAAAATTAAPVAAVTAAAPAAPKATATEAVPTPAAAVTAAPAEKPAAEARPLPPPPVAAVPTAATHGAGKPARATPDSDMLSAFRPTPVAVPTPTATVTPAATTAPVAPATPAAPVSATSMKSGDEDTWEKHVHQIGSARLTYSKSVLMSLRALAPATPPVLPSDLMEAVAAKGGAAGGDFALRPGRGPPRGGALASAGSQGMQRVGSGGSLSRMDREGRDGGRGGRGGRGQRDGRGGRRQDSRTEPLGPIEKLTASETGYKVVKPKDELERIQRVVQSLLNKLTPENFEKLYKQLLEVDINSQEVLELIISVIFQKAVDEPGFCPLYADVCKRMAELKIEFPAPEGSDGKPITFKRLLLNRCQQVFEQKAKPTEEAAVASDAAQTPEQIQAAFKERRFMLGNIKFIGELFRRNMLTERIMYYCIDLMLKGATTVVPAHDAPIQPHEEMMEGLCKLLTTVGVILDSERAKHRADLERVWTDLKTLMVNKELFSSRIRFMIQDLVELRQKQRWIPRQAAAGPKKLSDIKEEQARDPRLAAPGSRPAPPPQQRTPMRALPPAPAAKPAADEFRVVGRPGTGAASAASQQQAQAPQRGGRHTGGSGAGSGGRYDRSGAPPGVHQSNAFGALLAEETESPLPSPVGAIAAPDQRRGPRTAAPAPVAPVAPAAVAAPAPAAVKEVDEERALKVGEAIIREYLQIKDIKEAATCVEELHPTERRAKVVEIGLRIMLEEHESEREKIAEMFEQLGRRGSLTEAHFDEGFGPIIGELDDLVYDYPRIMEYLALFMARLLVSKSMPAQFLNDIMEEVEGTARCSKLLGSVMLALRRFSSTEEALRLLKESGVSTVASFGSQEKFDTWATENGFVASEAAPAAAAAADAPTDFLSTAFASVTAAPEPATLTAWIATHAQDEAAVVATFPAFASGIMRLIAHIITAEGKKERAASQEVVSKYAPVLIKLLGESQALQSAFTRVLVESCLAHAPKKTVVKDVLWLLYDNDVLTEDALRNWKDNAPNTPAKEIAIKQSVEFFTWLDEAAEESDGK